MGFLGYGLGGGFLAALFFGPNGFLWGFLAGAVFWVYRYSTKEASRPSRPSNIASGTKVDVGSQPISLNPSYLSRFPLRWIPANQKIVVSGYEINSGLIYVSDGRPDDDEASAIDTKLPVASLSESNQAAPLGYYSQYRYLSEAQRANYLNWLSMGRKDSSPAQRDVGYLFLFFYGLERRLLVDHSFDADIFPAIGQLLELYASHVSKSFPSYAFQLIHFVAWQQGPEHYFKLWHWIEKLPGFRLDEDGLSLLLAAHHLLNKPVTHTLAYELAAQLPESRKSVVVTRVNEEFREVFQKRYLTAYPEGLILKCAKRDRAVQYRPASPTLLSSVHARRSQLSLSIPNALGVLSQFRQVVDIWNSCIDDLSDYSRAKSRAQDIGDSLKAHVSLPSDLRDHLAHPLEKEWRDILGAFPAENGHIFLPVSEIAKLLKLPQRDKFTVSHSREIAETIESFGFSVEPDVRHNGCPYSRDQEIALFRPLDPKKRSPPSQGYAGASALLRLCVLVAAADGHIRTEELDVFREFIEKQLPVNAEEHQRLLLLERLLVDDPSVANVSVTQIMKRVPAEKRELVGRVLVYVAAADNLITKEEVKALGRIFKLFDFSSDHLESLLTTVQQDIGTVTIQQPSPRMRGEAIPLPSTSGPITLDMARVAKISEETAEVITILAQAMAEKDQEMENSESFPSTPNTEVQLRSEAPECSAMPNLHSPDWMKTLDRKYRPILLRILSQSSWTRRDFDSLAREFKLMPLDVFDSINGWADTELGDFVLEGEDPIIIHKAMLPTEESHNG